MDKSINLIPISYNQLYMHMPGEISNVISKLHENTLWFNSTIYHVLFIFCLQAPRCPVRCMNGGSCSQNGGQPNGDGGGGDDGGGGGDGGCVCRPGYTGPNCGQRKLLNSFPPGQNGRHFADEIFRCIFVDEKFCISIQISPKFVLKCPIDNNLSLV